MTTRNRCNWRQSQTAPEISKNCAVLGGHLAGASGCRYAFIQQNYTDLILELYTEFNFGIQFRKNSRA